ncbi:MAG TPA: ZIP family metal transporter [Candidatus Bilamarchaeum sp.]|nr:ZIP family metal transporter [Candidatus Bilamarchaeum sp.]
MILEALAATVAVSMVSLVGIALLSLNKKTMDTVVFVILSFATGTLFAAAFFDLLPEAIEGLGTEGVFATALSGIMVFFVLERLVHWHHEHHDHREHEKPVAYLVLVGDGLHNFFDGVAIMASFITSAELGMTTTFAIIFHEIPQELSDFTLLKYAGFSTKKALIFNLLSGLTSIVGAVAFFYFASSVDKLQFYGLAFTAGAFLYIAGTDMLPELHKQEEASKSVIQLVSMVFGIVFIWFLINNLGG